MRSSLLLPHTHTHREGWRSAFHISQRRRQVLLDKLAVFAALLVIVATFAVCIGYVVQEFPMWRAGQIGGYEIVAIPTPQGSLPAAAPASTSPSPLLGRIPLVLISTAIELVIFVALGLYLRNEMKQMP